jgi:hypothetical protein
MKRLLYCLENTISIIHKQNHTLDLIATYENNTAGLKSLEEYLKQSVKIPIHILLDVIDEEFFHESIPHVFGKDKHQVVKRSAERLFRQNHGYYYFQNQGREKEGRRNDKILLSGLTNYAHLQAILDLLHCYQIPIVTIWSLPIISQKLIPILKLEKKSLLIVSLQNAKMLRLTFVHNGLLSTSRLASIYHGGELQSEEFSQELIKEVEQTQKYLTNKRLLGFNEAIHICVIVSDHDYNYLKEKISNFKRNDYRIISTVNIEQYLKIKNNNIPNTLSVFSELCFKENIFKNHYTTTKEKKSYFSYLYKKILLNSSYLLFIISIIVAQYFFSQGEKFYNKTDYINKEVDEKNNYYVQNYLPLEEKFQDAVIMHSAVQASNELKRNKKNSPLDFYILLSKSYAQSGLDSIKFTQINWYFDITKKPNKNSGSSDPMTGNEDLSMISDDNSNVRPVAIIQGELPLYDNQFRNAVLQLDILTQALESQEQIKKVTVNKYPIDVRPTQKLDASGDMLTHVTGTNPISFEVEVELNTKNSLTNRSLRNINSKVDMP